MKFTQLPLKLILGTFMLLFLAGCGDSPKETETPEEKPVVPNFVGKEISYQVGDLEMKGYMAYDENATGKKPGVLVVHEWWGHNDYARSRADKLARMGYVAFALDMYGNGKVAEHPDDAGKFAGMVMQNIDEAEARFKKAMEVLQQSDKTDTDKVAAVGYCFGGSVVLSMANLGLDLDGVAAFHSGLRLPVKPGDGTPVKAKVLVCNGADDPMISEEDVQNFEELLTEADVRYKYVSYPGVVHAYTNPNATELGKQFDLPLAYDEEADKKSWEELTEFLAGIF